MASSGCRPKRLTLAIIFLTGVWISALLGAATNAISGYVPPDYFVAIMGWDDVENVWFASVARGAFEGLLYGILFSLMFATGTGIITRAACSYPFAVRHLLAIPIGAFCCWINGALVAMYYASLSPSLYRVTFIDVPYDFTKMLAYAWVGGSIWGIEFGGLASTIISLLVLRANWRRTQRRAVDDSSALSLAPMAIDSSILA